MSIAPQLHRSPLETVLGAHVHFPRVGRRPTTPRGPATGEPAFTGVVQATSIAPTALEAEARAKAAVLSGPDAAPGWLAGGGVLVLEDAGHVVLQPPLQNA